MRARSILFAALLVLLLPAVVLGARPTHETISLNDPSEDAAESALVTGLCGFAIDAQVSGHINLIVFDRGGAPGVQELNVYGIRITYKNPANGEVVRLRDIGPDRFYIQDGTLYAAITGRSETGSGGIGVWKINLETGEIVHQAGREVGVIYDRICDELS